MAIHIKKLYLPKPVRWSLFWATLIVYWLLLGYMISDIFQEKIIDFSKSKKLRDKLRGNRDGGKTEKLRIFIVVASLIIDWGVAGLILSMPAFDSVAAEELHLLKQADAQTTLDLLLALFGIAATAVFAARFIKWKYFDVTNMRKILVVLLTTNTLAFISVSLQRPAFLYLPVIASLWSFALFFYGILPIHTIPKPYIDNGKKKPKHVEPRLEVKLKKHQEDIQKTILKPEEEPEE